MTARERRRAALRQLLADRTFTSLRELRRALASKGYRVQVPQLFKDAMAIRAYRVAYWTIDPSDRSPTTRLPPEGATHETSRA